MAESASEQDEANPTFWLATQAGKMNSSYPLGISRVGPASKSSLFSHIINPYWPSLLVFIDLNIVSVKKNSKKNIATI